MEQLSDHQGLTHLIVVCIYTELCLNLCQFSLISPSREQEDEHDSEDQE